MLSKPEISEEILEMAKIFKALSHPVRIYIIKKLIKRDASCYSGDLVEELPVGRSTLSQHLKELKYAGLIQGEIHPPYIKYCINRQKWEEAKKLMALFFNDNQNSSVMKKQNPVPT
jgi:predicted transcriptional regulator